MSIGKSLIAESEPQNKNVKCVTNTLNSYTRNIYYAVFKFIENCRNMLWYRTVRKLLSKPVA